jgi:hypothetical protein
LKATQASLEISTNLTQNQPGRLQFFSSPSAAPVVVAGGLIGPIGMARDEQTNTIYIASIFTGTILKVQGVQ